MMGYGMNGFGINPMDSTYNMNSGLLKQNNFNQADLYYLQQVLQTPNANNPVFQSQNNMNNPFVVQKDNTNVAPTIPTTAPEAAGIGFKGANENIKEENQQKDSGIGKLVGILAVGATIAGGIASFRRGKGLGFKGTKAVKEGFKSFFKSGKAKVNSEILNKGGKNIEKFAIKNKNGSQYLFKQGNTTPYEIIQKTQNISTGAKLNRQLSNTSLQANINALDLSAKEVSTIGRTIDLGKHKLQVIYGKEGEVKEVFAQIKGNTRKLDLNKFKEKYGDIITKAETFSKNIGKKELSIPNANGFDKITENLTLNVRNGKLVSVSYPTENCVKEITDSKILENLEKTYSKEIENIAKAKPNISEAEKVFEYTQKAKNGNRVIRFNGADREVSQITRTVDHKYTQTDKINKILEENNLKSDLETMVSTGKIQGDYELGEFIYKDSGVTFKVANNKLDHIILDKDITINGVTIPAGQALKETEIIEWAKVAENNNILEKFITILS